jgi:hypothetical protein
MKTECILTLMSDPILILAENGSPFCRRLSAAISSRGADCQVRSLDAAFESGPVALGDGEVTWEGVNLKGTAAIFLERPLFSWPQPARQGSFDGPRELGARALEREARSLTISALLAAESSRPVVNRMAAGFMCSSRAAALVELEAAGLAVHPWRVMPAPREGGGEDGIVVDLVGGERWHRPIRPPEGHHALMLEPLTGEVFGLLVVGGEVAGGRRYPSAAAWSAGRGGETAPAGRVSPDASALGVRAAAHLDLEIAEIWVGGGDGGCRVLLVEAGPDLAGWDTELKGEASGRIADRLIAVARR